MRLKNLLNLPVGFLPPQNVPTPCLYFCLHFHNLQFYHQNEKPFFKLDMYKSVRKINYSFYVYMTTFS